jgi:tetratricopeptide (TPR) repeat protein
MVVFACAAAAMAALAAIGWWTLARRGPLAAAEEAYSKRDWSDAATRARDRLRLAPDDSAARRLFARASARLGKDDVAKAQYARLKPGDWAAEDHFLIGGVIARAGDLNLAIKTYELALNGDPARGETLDALARAERRSGALIAAAEHARRLAAAPGWEVSGFALLGALRAELNEPEAAAEAFQGAIAARRAGANADGSDAPTVAALARSLARALLRLGRGEDARAALEASGDSPGADLESDWLFSRAALQAGGAASASASTSNLFDRAARYRNEHPAEPEPAPWVGSNSCEACHRDATHAVLGSRHSRTFAAASEINLDDPALAPKVDRTHDPAAPSRALHTLRKGDDGSLAWESTIDGEVVRAVVDYAFGSGDRGLTFVGRDTGGVTRELRLSHYADFHGWDVTNGQDRSPRAKNGYLGKVLAADPARRCLDCHTTDARAARDRSGPTANDHAIGCERCHGPGGRHKPAVNAGLPDLAIAAGRGKLAAADVTRLCGQCHAARGMAPKPDNPYSTRFQADTLAWSRCYTQSGGGLSCLTCHDPHRDAETSAAFYDAKCLACHSGAPKPAACPVSPKKDCVSCHMPVEKTAVIPHTRFTDHFIRVHRESP